MRNNGSMLRLRIILVLAGIAGLTVVAQNTFTGRWLVEITNPDGEHRDVTFSLKQSGDTFTGAVLQKHRMQDLRMAR